MCRIYCISAAPIPVNPNGRTTDVPPNQPNPVTEAIGRFHLDQSVAGAGKN